MNRSIVKTPYFVDDTYVRKQNKWKEPWVLNNCFGTGFCVVQKDSKRIQGDVRDYLDVVAISEACGISQDDATEWIRTLKRIGRRHKFFLPLPSEYRTMRNNIFRKTSWLL